MPSPEGDESEEHAWKNPPAAIRRIAVMTQFDDMASREEQPPYRLQSLAIARRS